MDKQKEAEKLSRFISAVNSVTDKQVKEIMDEAEQERGIILSRASAAAEEARQRYIDDHMKMSANKYVRMVSKAELEKKREVLLCREELTCRLFERVIERIKSFCGTKEYSRWLERNIKDEESLAGVRICVSPADMRLADVIKKAAGKDAEIVPDDSIKYGGYYIIRSDRGTVTDKTFDCALKEQQSLFSSKNLLAAGEGHEN